MSKTTKLIKGSEIESVLEKRGEKEGAAWKSRLFVVKDGNIIYYETSNGMFGGNRIREKGKIPLNKISFMNWVDENSPDNKKNRFPFDIVTPDRVYHVRAPSKFQRNHWLGFLREKVSSLNERKSMSILPVQQRRMTINLRPSQQAEDNEVEDDSESLDPVVQILSSLGSHKKGKLWIYGVDELSESNVATWEERYFAVHDDVLMKFSLNEKGNVNSFLYTYDLGDFSHVEYYTPIPLNKGKEKSSDMVSKGTSRSKSTSRTHKSHKSSRSKKTSHSRSSSNSKKTEEIRENVEKDKKSSGSRGTSKLSSRSRSRPGSSSSKSRRQKENEKRNDDSKSKHAMRIINQVPAKTIYLAANSSHEVKRWIRVINRSIKRRKANSEKDLEKTVLRRGTAFQLEPTVKTMSKSKSTSVIKETPESEVPPIVQRRGSVTSMKSTRSIMSFLKKPSSRKELIDMVENHPLDDLAEQPDIEKAEFVLKKGKKGSTWRIRLLVLRKSNLSYYDNYELDQASEPLGVINFSECVEASAKEAKDVRKCKFRLFTKYRTYHFDTVSDSSRNEWVSILQKKIRVFNPEVTQMASIAIKQLKSTKEIIDLGKRDPFKLEDVRKLEIIKRTGQDSDGTPIISIFGEAFSKSAGVLVDMDRLLMYFLVFLEEFVQKPYILLFFQSISSSHHPISGFWLKAVYKKLDKKYRKNLKNLYIVAPSTWLKVTFGMFRPLLSKKFWKKLIYIEDGFQLEKELISTDLDIPKAYFDLQQKEKEVAVFGISLSSLIDSSSDENTVIPKFLYNCIEYIRSTGLDTEGIFRLPPSKLEMDTMISRINKGEEIDFRKENIDINLAASLCKEFFRSLPEPLIPFEAYDAFVSYGRKIKGEEGHEKKLKKLLETYLPIENQMCLSALLLFLREVSDHEGFNKMGDGNLAVVFGPNLLRPMVPSMEKLMGDIGPVNAVLKTMIRDPSLVIADYRKGIEVFTNADDEF